MENQYKRLFDSIAPPKSDEELLKAVLDRKAEKNMSTKKKFSKKAIVIPAVAAALLGTTAIGVSAAYQWNLSAAFEDLFRNRYEEYNGSSNARIKDVVFDFSVIGKELDLIYNFDNFDVVIKGITADEHSAYLLYDIVFAEDYDYELADGESWRVNLMPNIDLSWVMNYEGEMSPSSGWSDSFLGMEGSTAHCLNVVNTVGISLQGKPVVYSFDSLVRNGSSVKSRLGENKFSVDIDFDTTANSVDLTPNETITIANGATGTLDYVGLSTFGVGIDVRWDSMDDPGLGIIDELKRSVVINFKDGTTSDSSMFIPKNDMSGNRYSINRNPQTSAVLYWLYPVYMEDIESITIGDKTYKVERVDNASDLAPFDFSTIGKEIGEAYEGLGYTLTVNGVVADAHTAHFIYTIEFNDKFPLDYKHTDVKDTGWFDWAARDFSVKVNGKEANVGMSSSDANNLWLDENTLQRSFMVFCDEVSFENSDVTLTIGSLVHSHITDHIFDDTQEIYCGMSVDFTLGDMSGMELVLTPNKIFALDGIGSAVISEVKITPFKLTYTVLPADGQQVEFDKFCSAVFEGNGDTGVTLKNGAKVFANIGMGSQKDGGMESFMEMCYPVDPADVASVIVCGHEIDIL